jgi:enterochelin esterase family protein
LALTVTANLVKLNQGDEIENTRQSIVEFTEWKGRLVYGWVAVWSAGVNPQTTADFEKRAAAFLDNPERINKQIKLFSISVGDKDFALAGSKNLAELLNKRGIKHELVISGGGHTWINWRQYLNNYATRLFR